MDHVLLCGEAGGDTCALAEQLHDGVGTLVVLDCRAPPGVLVESISLGHLRSHSPVRPGVFQQAAGGTLVLDELAAIPRELLPRVERVLATRQVRAIGSNTSVPMTARVVATTFEPERLPPNLRALFAESRVPPLHERCGALLAERGVTLAPGELARLARVTFDVAALDRIVASADRSAAITELELLDAIARTPDDDAPRTVYADWLCERGDPRGELIQIQCRLVATPNDRRLLVAERALLDTHGSRWLAPVLAVPHVRTATLQRGFVEIVEGTADALRVLDVLITTAPTVAELRVDPPTAADFEPKPSPTLATRLRIVSEDRTT